MAVSHFTESVRLQRNLAEKQRRDKLNGYILELTNLVPLVSRAGRRVDKTSVLRLSAAYLRLHKCLASVNNSSGLKDLDSPEFMALLQAAKGFFLLTDNVGKILFCSHTVELYLGYQNIDLMGHSLLNFIHPAEHALLLSGYGSARKSRKFEFLCRMRDQDQARTDNFRLMRLSGYVASSGPRGLVGIMVHPSSLPFPRVPLQSPDEYVTRHHMDGTILSADHRLSLITGHLPSEVHGFSAYHFIVWVDIPLAAFAHTLMFKSQEGTGTIVYRLLTRNQKYIYLQSFGHVQHSHFVCINRLLSPEEGERALQEFRHKFMPHSCKTPPETGWRDGSFSLASPEVWHQQSFGSEQASSQECQVTSSCQEVDQQLGKHSSFSWSSLVLDFQPDQGSFPSG